MTLTTYRTGTTTQPPTTETTLTQVRSANRFSSLACRVEEVQLTTNHKTETTPQNQGNKMAEAPVKTV